jgi:protein involved in polysaccharide export with SLBB domain
VHYAMVKNRYQILENMAQSLATKMREAKSFEDSSLGYYKVFSQATTDRVVKKSPFLKSGVFGFAAALAAMFLVCGFLVVKEICDDRLRTAADIERVAKMPVLGTLGDLDKMTPAEQAQWAFRTWTIIKGKLSVSQTDGIVCGFISAHHGEGRSTWIKLLSKTANMRGLRVLTVTTKATNQPAVHPHEAAQAKSEFFEKNGHANEGAIMKTLPSNVLSSPAQVTQELTDPNNNSLPMVHIPIPGWVWNLERRRHWQEAIDAWEKIDNLVLLVELPPANEPESILLAEKLPQVIWLTQSGQVTARETRMHLETLRHANCNLVGAVLNRQPVSFFRNQLGRWFGLFALTASLGLASTQAAEPGQADNTPTTTNVSFSVTSSTPRAEWQKKLTLGPGDVLNLGLYGDTNSFKSEVAVGPDGRISYMQARDILATGLTIDELRQRIDQELSKFYRSPHTLVTPVAFKSKRYVVMGKVVKKGVYPLDRPITVVEALARASGLETGILDRDTLDMADLTRSFLVRQGKRIAINFEKLFQEGDLSQNIQIEPDDYLYFPPTNLKELYVVGEVRTPGVVTYTSDASVAATIAGRGGFTDRAWKSRVLVIRGSLNRPETYVVDMLAIQDARSPDFKLQAKDIIFISSRPFIKAEELLDAAATAFIQSAVTSWAGLNVGPIIRRPIIPNIEHQD